MLSPSQTLANEGLKGMYKGFSAPLATVALFNAVLFASRGQMEVLLKHRDGAAPLTHVPDLPAYAQHLPTCRASAARMRTDRPAHVPVDVCTHGSSSFCHRHTPS